jgi:5-(carboxyamino)imidazole ribonucleotide synthase
MIKRVGVIGGGQLASMMLPAAAKLGLELIVQTPNQDDPAALNGTQVVLGAIEDVTTTAKLATLAEVITFENEFINLEALQSLANQGVRFCPSLTSLAPLVDKYEQRCYLQKIGLPIPEFKNLTTLEDINSVKAFPVVLKARRHGYDGQGTFIIKSQQELETTWQKIGCPQMLLESYIPFSKELAVMAARNCQGEIAIYSVVETQQQEQVCRRVYAPAAIAATVNLEVEAIARTLLEKLDVIGILGIELFLTEDNQVLVNEIAPRTHNSGHYTIDACLTSQFEMHLRAITGLPLGDPSFKGVIKGINRDLTIIDLTHEIPPQNLSKASFCLGSAFPYLSADTIYIAVVDPGVGSQRRAIALHCANGSYLIGPDNGIFTGIFNQVQIIAAKELTNRDYWRTQQPSYTFHGRDIFAPVGAHLASGVAFAELGNSIEIETLCRLPLKVYQVTASQVLGVIQDIDHFGNLISNIPAQVLEGKTWFLEVSGKIINPQTSYSQTNQGELLALINSEGWLEIAVNGGSAVERLKLGLGDCILVKIEGKNMDK